MRPVNIRQMWNWPNSVWPNAVTAGDARGQNDRNDDNDETPLRLTASESATRGVMVSGIMGALVFFLRTQRNESQSVTPALDIAPTLHFVEPGLKINGEE